MTFSQLHYFMMVAETGNISSAARKLFITQQALSAQISLLESEFHVRLFERTHPLRLTIAGEQFYSNCQKIIFDQKQLVAEMEDLSLNQERILKIGVSSAYAKTVLPRVLPPFINTHPHTRIKIYERVFADITDLLDRHDADIILARPIFSANYTSIPLIQEDLKLFAPHSALVRAFGDMAGMVHEKLLRGESLRMMSGCTFILAKTGSVRKMTDEFLAEQRVIPNIRIETDFLETAISLCKASVGITFAPTYMLRNPDSGTTAPEGIYDLKGSNITHSVNLYYDKNYYFSKSMADFINICESTFNEHEASPLS